MSDIKKIRKAIDLFNHQDAVSYLKAVFDHVKSLRRRIGNSSHFILSKSAEFPLDLAPI